MDGSWFVYFDCSFNEILRVFRPKIPIEIPIIYFPFKAQNLYRVVMWFYRMNWSMCICECVCVYKMHTENTIRMNIIPKWMWYSIIIMLLLEFVFLFVFIWAIAIYRKQKISLNYVLAITDCSPEGHVLIHSCWLKKKQKTSKIWNF